MLRTLTKVTLIPKRSFKNFGHKRQRIPLPTTLWHGFLTFTFIGLGLEWDVISRLIFGGKDYDEEIDKGVKNMMKIEPDQVTN